MAQRVYFPDSGLVSLILTSLDGIEIEVSLAGREGLVGAAGLLGSDRTLSQAVVQIAGRGWQMPASVLFEQFRKGGALQLLLFRYLQFLLIQSFQTTLCNRRHSVVERLSRWLLTTQDRVGSAYLPVTQSLMAHMLGTRRPGITEACGVLAGEGLVECGRGYTRILDHEGLIRKSCECYSVINKEFQRIFANLPERGV